MSRPLFRGQTPEVDAHTHLDVDHVREDLGQRSIRSGFMGFLERGGILALSIGSTAALARLLTPEDFGLIAMVSVLTAIVKSFKNFGLPMALVHREEIRPEAANALYWMTVGLSAVICLAMAVGSPLLALLFSEPRLVPLTAATAGALFLLALGAPHRALLMRQMRFGTLASVSIGAEAVGMAIGVIAAWRGLGPWALILQLVMTNLLLSVLWSVASSWRPVFRPRTWRHSGLRVLTRYGLSYSGFGLIEHIGRRLDRVLVGVVGGASVLGLYDNAFRWSLFPLQQVFKPLLGVAVAGLSRVQDDAARFRDYIRRSVLPVLGVALPTLAFVSAAADPVVRVLLGDQWIEAIPLLQWLSAAAFLRCFSKVAQWLFLAEGRTQIQLRWGLISTPFFVIAVVIGVQWGAYGVAVGFFTATALMLLPELAVALRGSAVGVLDLAAAAWRPIASSLAAATSVALAVSWLPLDAFLALGSSAMLFACVYALFWLALPGGVQAAREVFSLLRSLSPAPSPTS